MLWNFAKSKYLFLRFSKLYRSIKTPTKVHKVPLLLLLKIYYSTYVVLIVHQLMLQLIHVLILRKTVISRIFQRCFRVDNTCQKKPHGTEYRLGCLKALFHFFVLNHSLLLIVNSFRRHHQPQMAAKSHSLNIQLTAVIFFRHEECEIYYKSDSKIYFTRSR